MLVVILVGCFVLLSKFIYLFLAAGSLLLHGLLSRHSKCVLLSSCSGWASSLAAQHGLEGTRASVVMARGLSSCGSWAPEHKLNRCGAWA